MFAMNKLLRARIAAALLAAALWTVPAHAADSSTQVHFSGIGVGTFNSTSTPFGFWIWCQPTTTNAYGNGCQGSMYFYRLFTQAESVTGPISGSKDLGYTITASSVTGPVAFTCTLTNTSPLPPSNGPTNTVVVKCGSAFSLGGTVSGSGTSTNAAVGAGQ